MKQLLTVGEAAALVKRSKPTIYRWIDQERVEGIDGTDGLCVRSDQVMKVAAETRRGRPPVNRES